MTSQDQIVQPLFPPINTSRPEESPMAWNRIDPTIPKLLENSMSYSSEELIPQEPIEQPKRKVEMFKSSSPMSSEDKIYDQEK